MTPVLRSSRPRVLRVRVLCGWSDAAAAASLRRRLDGRRAGATRPGWGATAVVVGVTLGASAGADQLVVTAGGSPTTAALMTATGIILGLAAGLGWLFRTRLGLDAPSRELRRRISAETRTAAAVEPLEGGWYHLARAVIPILDQPARRVAAEPHPVVHLATGKELRRALETELPTGLSRTAVAYLASIVDHTCPPA